MTFCYHADFFYKRNTHHLAAKFDISPLSWTRMPSNALAAMASYAESPDLSEVLFISDGSTQFPRLDDLPNDHPKDPKEVYRDLISEIQMDLVRYQRMLMESDFRMIFVFEGPDAVGKGGAIKRLIERLDPRLIHVHGTTKPTTEELRHHYMRRFWLRLPPKGLAAIYDRSWYGRVLVERVEGFATKKEWQRAYDEINQFEKLLADDNTLFLKFYLHFSKEEQLRRFKEREEDPYKFWKIGEEDWRNREKWAQHNEAADDMFKRTSTPHAPWYLVATDHKWTARLAILKCTAELFARYFKLKRRG